MYVKGTGEKYLLYKSKFVNSYGCMFVLMFVFCSSKQIYLQLFSKYTDKNKFVSVRQSERMYFNDGYVLVKQIVVVTHLAHDNNGLVLLRKHSIIKSQINNFHILHVAELKR